ASSRDGLRVACVGPPPLPNVPSDVMVKALPPSLTVESVSLMVPWLSQVLPLPLGSLGVLGSVPEPPRVSVPPPLMVMLWPAVFVQALAVALLVPASDSEPPLAAWMVPSLSQLLPPLMVTVPAEVPRMVGSAVILPLLSRR